MDQRLAALSLLFLVVLASGCGDSGTQSEGSHALKVQGPELSRSTVFSGSDVNVRLQIENAGEMEGKLLTGPSGKKIMTDYCTDIFTIKRFQSNSQAEKAGDSYRLKPGQRVNMNWRLSSTSKNVPLNGYTCHLDFQAPFNYSVNAFRQIQIKDRDYTGESPELASKSSKGPLKIQIETVGSSSQRGAPVFLKDDTITVLYRFVNQEPEKSAYRGIMSIDRPQISVSQGSLENCENKGNMMLYEGKSQVVQCNLEGVDLKDVKSKRVEVSVSADYTYTRDLGESSVKVRYGG